MFALKTTILTVLLCLSVTHAAAGNEYAAAVLISDITYEEGLYYHKDRIFNGDIVDYYENDKLKFRYRVLAGRLHGQASEFFPSGKVKSVRNYTYSKLFGDFVEYYETGEVKASFEVKLHAYGGQGEIIENIKLGTLKNGRLKSKSIDRGIIYFVKESGDTFKNSELISILNQTHYRLMDAKGEKLFLEVE